MNEDVRRPKLAQCGLMPARLAARDVFRGWRRARVVSDRDVGAVLHASQHRITQIDKGDASPPMDVFFALQDAGCLKDALDLLDRIRL